eukprot:g7124.t1
MDQDVEAILNAPDSDDDDGLNVQGVSLEDILREDDGGSNDGDDDLLLDDAEANPPHLLGSTGAHQELDRWRGDSGAGRKAGTRTGSGTASSDRRPLAYRDTAAGSSGAAGGGLLSPPSFSGGGGPSSVGFSDRLSGDGSSSTYADGNGSLSGAPPRTAFLSRDEVSEDSRLLQQILKESEEEIAASAAERANGFGGGDSGGSGGGGTKTKLVSAAAGAGSGDDLYGGADDNLHSLDVDRIIESMELEAEVDGEVTASGGRGGSGMPPWRASAAGAAGAAATATATATSSSRRRSFTADGVGGGGGDGGGGGGGGVKSSGRRERGASASGASASSPPRSDDYGLGVPSSGSGTAPARQPNGEPMPASRARRKPSLGGGGRSPVSGGLLTGATGGGGGGGGELGLTGALRKAEAAELRLLRGGNREMISPLQVKRRMRAPPPPPPPGQLSTGFQGIGGGGAGGAGGVGVVRMENLDAASRQLARNAAYGKHGPGVCTAAAAHSKFIAVGTSRGLILLFDHFQEIRHVLGSAGGGGADGAPADDPVTSLDMFVGSDYLVAGHGSGQVFLWDYLRGVVLKAVVDVHSSAVVSVRCFVQGGGSGGGGSTGSSDPAAITADVEGVVNKMCFRRVMWTKWVVDTECLLDGAAGPIPALCVLPSWTDAGTSSSTAAGGARTGAVKGVSPGFFDLGMMAMSSWKNTFIVGIYPEVKVIHKWPRPPLFSAAGGAGAAAAADHVPPPCLSWGPPQPSAARAGAPSMALLARGWGNSIQILAATRAAADTGGGGGAAGKVATRWPGLAVVKELSASAPVVAVEWLREQVLAYLDADMELCVLDTRAGTELEHASLTTLGVSISPILPPPPSSSSLAPPPPSSSPGGAGGATVASPPPLGTYHNAFRACEGRLYLLGRQELRAVRVQGWSQRVESLVQAGEWLEALAVALDHFEQKILPAENAAAAAAAAAESADGGASSHGSDGGYSGAGFGAGSRHGSSSGGGDLWSVARGGGGAMQLPPAGAGSGGDHQLQRRPPPPRSEAAEHISDLLAQYLRLAINNAPAAEPSSSSATATPGAAGMGGSPGNGARINLAHSHFQMLAGVCAEFCAVTGRLDMLFGQIFHAFRARGQQGVFLDTLEPYVLMGKLKTLSPEVVAASIDRCQSGGDMIAAERLVLRLEPRSLGLATTLPLLRRHRLHSALLAVRASRGDYVSSVEEVLQEVMSIAERDQPHCPPSSSSSSLSGAGGNGHGHGNGNGIGSRDGNGSEQQQAQLCPYPADPTFDELGYKVLLYLKRSFRGRVLGAAEPLSEAETAKARASLLHLLVRPSLHQGPSPGSGSVSMGREASSSLLSSPHLEPSAAARGADRRRRRRWQDALFPYLSVLLYVDAGAAIDVLSVAMDSPEAIFRRDTTPTSNGPGDANSNDLASTAAAAATAASPALLRESSSSSSLASFEAAGGAGAGAGGARKGSARNGEALGGGVWGRRLGRRGRTARAIGWSSAAAAAGDTDAAAAATAARGDGGRWRRVGMGAVAAAAENSCPSRRSIVEAVTSVLAPHLSARAEQLDEASSASAAAVATASDDGSAEDGGGGLSASAFVHGTQPPSPPPSAAAESTEEHNGDDKAFPTAAAAAAEAAAESPSSLLRDRDGQEWWAAARPHLFGFVAKYLELSLVSVGPRLTNAVLVSAATGANSGGGGGAEAGLESPADPQARLVTLLERVPLALVDRDKLLPLAEQSGFFRAAVILLKAAVTLGEQRGFTLEQFARIVSCYLQDSDDAFRSQVFGFIRQEIARAAAATTTAAAGTVAPSPVGANENEKGEGERSGGGDSAEAELADKRDVVLSKLPQLMGLNKAEAVFTVGEAFRGDHKAALKALAATTTLQFEYLDALLRPSQHQEEQQQLQQRGGVGSSLLSSRQGGGRGIAVGGSGGVGGGVKTRSSSSASSGSRPVSALAAGLDDGDRSLHVRLLVRFRPYEVYPFLSSSTGYSLDDTLALCQERGVADATAYLLERKGDVPGALALALRTLSARLAALRTALQGASLRDLAAEMAFSSSAVAASSSTGGVGAGLGSSSPHPFSPKRAGDGGFGAGSVGMGPRAGTAAWARWASKVALEGLQEGREAARSLMVAIEMCQRASPNVAPVGPTSLRATGARHRSSTGGASGGEGRGGRSPTATDDLDDDVDSDLDLSASLWFQTLDKILSAKGAACRSSISSGTASSPSVAAGGGAGKEGASERGRAAVAAAAAAGELPQTAAVMGGVLDALLQRTLSSMAGYVPLPAIVKKVVSDHAGSSLGEFRHVILAMLDTYSYDTAIHRTAASLLFDSLRTVVRERHTLKGAGVRVTSVAGFDLHPPRANGANNGAPSTAAAGTRAAAAASAAVSEAAEDDMSVDGDERPPPPPPVPAELMNAVGSGVISISPRGRAVVEHLGRGDGGIGGGNGSGGGQALYDEDGSGGGGSSGDAARRAAAAAAATAPQQGASVSLWRLRAARRRRQARGNKMRALVGWAAGEDVTASWNAGGGDGRGRERGGVHATARGGSRTTGRSGAVAGGESGRAQQPQPGPAAGAGYLLQGAGDGGGRGGAKELREAVGEEEEDGPGGRQALGWGSALQARALALPASLLPKRA